MLQAEWPIDVRPSGAPLHIEVHLLQAELVETLLYGYVTWKRRSRHCIKLKGAHRQFLTRYIGRDESTRIDHPLAYAEALLHTDCTETVDATMRKNKVPSPGFVMRTGGDPLPTRVMLETSDGGKGTEEGKYRLDAMPKRGP